MLRIVYPAQTAAAHGALQTLAGGCAPQQTLAISPEAIDGRLHVLRLPHWVPDRQRAVSSLDPGGLRQPGAACPEGV